jgi:alcohol dehydrogenase (cytochrome c)
MASRAVLGDGSIDLPACGHGNPQSAGASVVIRYAVAVTVFGAIALAGEIFASQSCLAADESNTPTYTALQAADGESVYTAKCATCHGAALSDGAAPRLSGPGFAALWLSGDHSVADLYGVISQTMPQLAPHSLSLEAYQDVVAFLLSRNGFEANQARLDDSTLSRQMTLRASGDSVATKNSSVSRVGRTPDTVISPSSDGPEDADLRHLSPDDWLTYNRDLTGQRFSPLSQIQPGNAALLTPVCVFQTGDTGSFQTAPVIFRGMMYLTTAYNTYAIDPSTCRLLWEYRYATDVLTPHANARGVALYRGRVFRATPDGHVFALDARTGKLLWDALLVETAQGYYLSSAPVAFDGKLFLGDAGADWGTKGHVYALDVATGKLLWTFDMVPTGTQPGAKSWVVGQEHGGGSHWSTVAVDAQAGLVLVPIGNPAPDFDGTVRPGNNLFTDSVVALEARTGKLAWYVQQTPHDTRDYDTAAAPAIYDAGNRALMAVASKNGWLYIYDRRSHREIARQELSSHLNDEGPLTGESQRVCPGYLGGAQWNGPAFAPDSSMLFVNSIEWCSNMRLAGTHFVRGAAYLGGDVSIDPVEKARGWIRAFDAVSGRQQWAREMPRPMTAALTPTAGGVLFTGDLDGFFLALDARSGNTLYSFQTGGAIASAPSTYAVGGKQYVAVPSGNISRTTFAFTRGAPTLFVFALR